MTFKEFKEQTPEEMEARELAHLQKRVREKLARKRSNIQHRAISFYERWISEDEQISVDSMHTLAKRAFDAATVFYEYEESLDDSWNLEDDE